MLPYWTFQRLFTGVIITTDTSDIDLASATGCLLATEQNQIQILSYENDFNLLDAVYDKSMGHPQIHRG